MSRRAALRGGMRWTLLSWALVGSLLAIPGCTAFDDDDSAEPTATATSLPQPPSSPAARFPDAPRELVQAVDALLHDEEGVYGVVLMRPDGTVLYSRDCNTPFVAASLYKLVLLADIYEARETGQLSFTQQIVLKPEYFPGPGEPADSYFDLSAVGWNVTIEEAVFATGAWSSNVAARALLDLTGQASFEQMAAILGLPETHLLVDPRSLPDWPPVPGGDAPLPDTEAAAWFAEDAEARDGPVNLTSPCDMARFFQKLLAGEVVSPRASAELVAILSQQAINDRFPVLLPPETKIAHKTGNLEHVVHDAGVIYGQDGPIILVALSEGMEDDERAAQVLQRLALVAYGEYDIPPISGTAASKVAPPSADRGTSSAHRRWEDAELVAVLRHGAPGDADALPLEPVADLPVGQRPALRLFLMDQFPHHVLDAKRRREEVAEGDDFP